jgi:2-C-methyl-D-erythritol 4-phosphate cytidylyltransferase
VAALGVEAVTGGEHRSQSVASALEAVDPDAAIVAVHDAARPLVTAELIDALVRGLASRPDAAGVIAAAPLTDTIKRGGESVEGTEDRERLWAAQTPQVFRAPALREALAADPRRLAAATDDAMLVESTGGEVLIHPAPPENIKVTTPYELRVAEMLLSERARD